MSTENLDSTKKRVASVVSYVDEKEVEETETSSDESDDVCDIDRNNNEDKSSSLAQHTSKQPSTSYGRQLTNPNNPNEQQLENSAENDSSTNQSLTSLNSDGEGPSARGAEDRRPSDKEWLLSREQNSTECDEFSQGFNTSRDDSIEPLLPANRNRLDEYTESANGNNSNNRRGRRKQVYSNQRSYGAEKGNFRPKSRSIQLSSIRAVSGMEKPINIQPYYDRIVCKDGSTHVQFKKLSTFSWMLRYTRDIYTTLLDLSWTWIVLLTAGMYIGQWVLFGLVYWIFALFNGDYAKLMGNSESLAIVDIGNTTFGSTGIDSIYPNVEDTNAEPCVSNVYDFVSAFLFSMESETTIGYGTRGMGTTCLPAVVCLVFQCVLSAIFDTWLIGMCFSRLARPDARSKTILFSKFGVTCTRDGKRCLLIRVANLRKSLLLSVSFRARIITLRTPAHREEKEGHQLMLEQQELSFQNSSSTLLTAPVEYCHIIDEHSPLSYIPESYLKSNQNWFELIVIVTGVVEATSMTTHAQTSYLSSEIKYGHRFVPILCARGDRYIVDFKKFHDVTAEPIMAKYQASSQKRFASKFNNRVLSEEGFEILLEESENEDMCDDVFTSSNNNNPCEDCKSTQSSSEAYRRLLATDNRNINSLTQDHGICEREGVFTTSASCAIDSVA